MRINLHAAYRLFRAGRVRRWHTADFLPPQDVAQHSWNAAILLILAKPSVTVEELKEILLHDVHELDFGDIPSPAKAQWPAIREAEAQFQQDFRESLGVPVQQLNVQQEVWINWADKMEGLMFLNGDAAGERLSRAIMGASAAQAVEEANAKLKERQYE
jgi:5'-deoxynucleotidase YfbR-like HD superfamily hydrolase